MAPPASMPAAVVACLLLAAVAVVSAGAPAPGPAPQGAADPPQEAANPCDHLECPLNGLPKDAFTAARACPGEGGGGVVCCCCCCCPKMYGRRCCSSAYCRSAPSPHAVLA